MDNYDLRQPLTSGQEQPPSVEAASKAAGSRRRPVCGAIKQTRRFKTVHLHKKLVQRLFPFVMAASQTRSSMSSHGIDFIDENDAGSIPFALEKEVSDSRGSDADKHLHEIRAANRKERNICLSGNGSGQEGFPCSRSPNEKNPLRNPSTEFRKPLGISEKRNNLLQLAFGLINPSHARR
jgi:hypothetical protein